MTNVYLGPELTYDSYFSFVKSLGFDATQRKLLVLSGTLCVDWSSDEYKPVILEKQQKILVIFGTPIYQNKRIDSPSLDALLSETQIKEIIREFDSVFTIIEHDKTSNMTRIYTDRFGSLNFFISSISQNTYAITSNLRNLYIAKLSNSRIQPDKAAVFEYLWFRRLFGDKTFISDIKTLGAGTILTFSGSQFISSSYYWTPHNTDSENSALNERSYSIQIEHEIRKGVRLATAGPTRHGLFLSGGLDSRALLGADENNKYSAITNTPSCNNELFIAKQLAKASGSKHIHLLRPDTYFDDIFYDAMISSNGITQYYECQFLGYRNQLRSLFDDVHLGLFLDVFYCGHYLPKTRKTLGTKTMLHFRLDDLSNSNIVDYFINNISYRQKTTDLRRIVNRTVFSSYYEELRQSINESISKGRDSGFSGYQLWEYMHLVNLGKHYSMLMANSLRPYVDVWTPILTNSAYDLAFTLPVNYKTNWSAYLMALNRLAPKLMAVRNSNTNQKAKFGLQVQSYIKLFKALGNVFAPGYFLMSPNTEDRSWPLVLDSLNRPSLVRDSVDRLLVEGRIFDLGLIDQTEFKLIAEDTFSGRADHSVVINQLLTLEHGFLQMI